MSVFLTDAHPIMQMVVRFVVECSCGKGERTVPHFGSRAAAGGEYARGAGKFPGKDLDSGFRLLLRARVKAGAPGRKPEVRDVIELRPGPHCAMSYTVHAGVPNVGKCVCLMLPDRCRCQEAPTLLTRPSSLPWARRRWRKVISWVLCQCNSHPTTWRTLPLLSIEM